MDQFTIRNLELVQSTGVNGVSLLNVLDHTVSPMGARMLRRWLVLPLKSQKVIQDRLNIVDYFTHQAEAADELVVEIKKMGDLERLISKVATARICPREVVQLKRALNAMVPVVESCSISKNKSLVKLASQLNPCDDIREMIAEQLQDDAPVHLIKEM